MANPLYIFEIFNLILSYCEEYNPAIMATCKSWYYMVVDISRTRQLRAITFSTLLHREHFSLIYWARNDVFNVINTHINDKNIIKYIMYQNSLTMDEIIYILSILLIRRANINIICNYFGNNLLLKYAAKFGDINLINFLEANGADNFAEAAIVAKGVGNMYIYEYCLHAWTRTYAIGN